ncbi:MAG: WG repeat-containing protein [Bacteroidaceae bacterium]|nr:WG repeat-containing protein [Bacteroidaceae bacterium]
MKYENAHSFHEGMAAVKLNGKWASLTGLAKK